MESDVKEEPERGHVGPVGLVIDDIARLQDAGIGPGAGLRFVVRGNRLVRHVTNYADSHKRAQQQNVTISQATNIARELASGYR